MPVITLWFRLLTFNRTIVELKRNRRSGGCHCRAPFNRTIVELKLGFVVAVGCRIKTFNRTIVELKQMLENAG